MVGLEHVDIVGKGVNSIHRHLLNTNVGQRKNATRPSSVKVDRFDSPWDFSNKCILVETPSSPALTT